MSRSVTRWLPAMAALGGWTLGAAGCLHTSDEVPWPAPDAYIADAIPSPPEMDPPVDAAPDAMAAPRCPPPPLQGGPVFGGGVRSAEAAAGRRLLVDRVGLLPAPSEGVMTDERGRSLSGAVCP